MVKSNTNTNTNKFKLIVKALTLLLVLTFSNSWGQTIVSDDFENATTLFSNAGGTYYSGNSAAGDRPATSGFAQSGTFAIGVSNGTAVFTSSIINTSACTTPQLTLKLASFSIGSTGNGADVTDLVKIEISNNGGGAYVNTLEVDGNANAYWSYTSGTGVASTSYGTPAIFAPTGGGARTTDGYSTLTITGLPSVANLVVRITLFNNSANERWVIDNFILSGTCCTAPTTTIAPTTQTLCAGSVTTLTVTSSATVPSYMWQASANGATGWANVVNNTPAGASYSGLNTSTLSITAGSTYYYHCLVTENSTCTATSGTSTLVVNTNPTITTQPVNKTICSGINTSFTVVASGSPLAYQWQEKIGAGAFANIANGGVYSGATAATLVLTNPGTGMSTNQYQCVITVASCSSVTTTAAVLTINTTPATPPAPSAIANPACTSGTLAAVSSTVAGVTWYWQGSVSTASVTTQSTATDYTLTASNNYYVRALDAVSGCWSSASSLSVTVNSPITITTQPIDREVCIVGNTTFVIAGAGTAPKQWQYSSNGGATFTNVAVDVVHSNVTNATMNLTGPTTALNGYVYQCVVSVAGCPAVTSNTALLNVYSTPAAPPAPMALANPACSGTTLSAMSSTVAGVTWYWQGITAAGSSTASPTSSSYAVSATGTYYVRARTDGSSCLSATSSNIVITINQPPAVTVDPVDRTQCVGANTTFGVTGTGTSLTYLWQIDTGGGFVNLANGAPYSNVTTATMSITGITAGLNGYKYRCIISGASPCTAATSNFGTLIITASGTPVTAASSPATSQIACNAFKLIWTNGSGSNRLVVVSSSAIAGSPVDGTGYTANSTYASGGTIAAGEYVVYNGNANTVFINGLSASTTYYYKIFEYNGCSLNYLTTGTIPNGNAITTICSSPAGATAVYVNACDGGCGFEGNNELIWATSGSYALKVATNGPSLHYNSTPTPTTTYISTYGLYASNVTALNTAVTSCTNTVFVDPNAQGYIPANANFLIAHSCMCSPASYDLSGLCNSGPIYVVFGNDAAWPCNSGGGIFGNSGAGTRYFDLNFNAWGIALDPEYNFAPNSLVGNDGAVVFFNPSGGAATTYSNTGCVVPLIILPIELADFYATKNGKKNDVVWKVASEENVIYYTIDKSNDGVNFTELAIVFSNSETQTKTYSIVDDSPFDDITYYRLGTKEKSGKVTYYKIISIDEKSTDWNCIHYQQEQNLMIEFKNSVPKNSTIHLFDLSGKLVVEETIKDSQTKINTQKFAEGIYFLRISTPYKTENFKLIISN